MFSYVFFHFSEDENTVSFCWLSALGQNPIYWDEDGKGGEFSVEG
jgi:hypothetical protein